VQTDKESNSVRLTGKFTSLEDIKNVQVAMPVLGSPVYVKDVAIVMDGIKEITSVSRYNGKKGIRAAFVNWRTGEKDVEVAIAEMKSVLAPSA
jgi:multidrug efflux pump subunit AcrB